MGLYIINVKDKCEKRLPKNRKEDKANWMSEQMIERRRAAYTDKEKYAKKQKKNR